MAKRGKAVQQSHMYVADFETCDTSTVSSKLKDGTIVYNQRVWLAGFKNLETMQSTYFNNLPDFMNSILARGDNQNTEYAFHNIKFDGSYIIPYLMSNGYTLATGKPLSGQFSVLVDDMNNWYSINIQVTKRRKVALWDSLKLFPSPLEYLPDVYGTPTKKVIESQDWYMEARPDGYIPNERDLMYFENDLQVPAETLNAHIDFFDIRFKKTQASQSFYNFTESFKAWKWRFPALTDEQDNSIRTAYWGGISHVNPLHKGKDIENIVVDDINSSYPDKAANNKLPYGNCIAEYGEGKNPDSSKFWIAEALVEFTLKPDHIPCIPSKSITEGKTLDSEKWLDNSNGIVKMSFSTIDFDTMRMSYDITVYRWCWSMHWAWKVHPEVARFVNSNNDIKVKYSKLAKIETDPLLRVRYNTLRNRAKIDNNTFYGKFGEEVIKYGKQPEMTDDGVKWVVGEPDIQSEHSRKFLPVAIAITAWGRQQLVIMANILGKHFIYCDTDSVHYELAGAHLIEQAEKDGIIKRDPELLGAWKLEGTFVFGRYLRAKCYIEIDEDGHQEATVAGLPADKHSGQFSKTRSCLNKENFHIGYIVPVEQANKLRTIRTATGNKLLPVGYQIKEKQTLFG